MDDIRPYKNRGAEKILLNFDENTQQQNEEIKDCELYVIVLEGAEEEVEIDTFITINIISLNSFVVSMRSFLYALQQYEVIPKDWTSKDKLSQCIVSLTDGDAP